MGRPVKTFNIGGVNAALWEKDGRFSITIEKRYQGADGNWKGTTFFDYRDMPSVAAISTLVLQYCVSVVDVAKRKDEYRSKTYAKRAEEKAREEDQEIYENVDEEEDDIPW